MVSDNIHQTENNFFKKVKTMSPCGYKIKPSPAFQAESIPTFS